ncbi:Cys/Met metabolism PLP-dependent enzyme-domain-containing protein [Gautieria morchelliformis]|nr:Cys/Met metabolism PLP-dependent enzyme-domain-containing protein [Gautieria morchelliformis]
MSKVAAQLQGLEVTFLDFDMTSDDDVVAAVHENTKRHLRAPHCASHSPYYGPHTPCLPGGPTHADVVLHSLTKYINGHSDVLMGTVIFPKAQSSDSDALYQKLLFIQNAHGAVPGAFDAWLAMRGAKTLALQMREHGLQEDRSDIDPDIQLLLSNSEPLFQSRNPAGSQQSEHVQATMRKRPMTKSYTSQYRPPGLSTSGIVWTVEESDITLQKAPAPKNQMKRNLSFTQKELNSSLFSTNKKTGNNSTHRKSDIHSREYVGNPCEYEWHSIHQPKVLETALSVKVGPPS